MKRGILTCLTVLTLSMAGSMSVLAAPEIMPDGGVFDAEYYAQNNPDVVQAYGTDKAALYSHYVNNGKAEGRLGVDPNRELYTKTITPSAEALQKIADTSGDVEGVDYYTATDVGDYYKIYRLGASQHWTFDYFKKGAEMSLYRTDFPDGLIDYDGNGIDDRDPINSMDVVDLNLNGVDDRSYYKIDYNKIFGYDYTLPVPEHFERHGVVKHEGFGWETDNDCSVCAAYWTAYYAELDAKYAINSYDLGYRAGDRIGNYVYTGIGDFWKDETTGKRWIAKIEYGEFKGWKSDYIAY